MLYHSGAKILVAFSVIAQQRYKEFRELSKQLAKTFLPGSFSSMFRVNFTTTVYNSTAKTFSNRFS